MTRSSPYAKAANRWRIGGRFLAALAISGAVCPPVLAQAPLAEVSGGYVYLADPEFNFPLGWFADVAVSVTELVAIVGDVSRSSKSVVQSGVPVDLAVTAYHGGVRFNARSPRATVFGQVLFGAGRLGAAAAARPNLGVAVTSDATSIQIGGGVLVPVQGRLGVRVGADYRALLNDDFAQRQFRVAVGASIALGVR